MQIIKEGRLKSTRQSLSFFKEHFNKLGEIKYIVLYYAEWEWGVNHDLYHHYVIVIGEDVQLWMSGLSWGYVGEGPCGLFEIMQKIDSSITFDKIKNLDWPGTCPILFENSDGRLMLQPFTNSAASLLCMENGRLPWFPL